MRDLHHARGSASGHYNDRGGKCSGDEERGRQKDRYNELETEAGSATQTAQEIETGTVVATEKESTRQRGGPASYLIMPMI